MTHRALKGHISAVHGRREHPTGEIRRDMIGAFLMCLILFGVKEWFVEKTKAGHFFEDATYQLLERRLSETLTHAEDVPVTVVNISPLGPKPIEKGLGGGRATPPKQLLELLEALAKAAPAGLAIDIGLPVSGNPVVIKGLDRAEADEKFVCGGTASQIMSSESGPDFAIAQLP